MKTFICVKCRQKKYDCEKTEDLRCENENICKTCAKKMFLEKFVCADCGEEKLISAKTKMKQFETQNICMSCARKKGFYICEICGEKKELKTLKLKKSLNYKPICAICASKIYVSSQCLVCGEMFNHPASLCLSTCHRCRYLRRGDSENSNPLYEKMTDERKTVIISEILPFSENYKKLTPKESKSLEKLVESKCCCK